MLFRPPIIPLYMHKDHEIVQRSYYTGSVQHTGSLVHLAQCVIYIPCTMIVAEAVDGLSLATVHV